MLEVEDVKAGQAKSRLVRLQTADGKTLAATHSHGQLVTWRTDDASFEERKVSALAVADAGADNIASTMGYFFFERQNDVKNLADSREVLTYFVAYTDDAYVRSDLVAVAPEITGRIIAGADRALEVIGHRHPGAGGGTARDHRV